jgi:hypothetical protein
VRKKNHREDGKGIRLLFKNFSFSMLDKYVNVTLAPCSAMGNTGMKMGHFGGNQLNML